jgi:hypothetical protein
MADRDREAAPFRGTGGPSGSRTGPASEGIDDEEQAPREDRLGRSAEAARPSSEGIGDETGSVGRRGGRSVEGGPGEEELDSGVETDPPPS